MKRLLMVAYHFPPLAGSSGIQRTLRFVQHLPSLGWQPLVLSAHPRAYEKTSEDLLDEIPAGTVVRRAFALDAARHLQIGGHYLGWMARPDRWISWKTAAVQEGLKLIRQFHPDVIWSTYPIATAHVIALALHRKTGIPWVADFRDPMFQDDYPVDLRTRNVFKEIEADITSEAHYCVFTTPGAARIYQQRYPLVANRMHVVENGYDEESFSAATLPPLSREGGPIRMLHSGIVYPSERDPRCLFEALGRLKREGALNAMDLRICFRASVHDELLKHLAHLHDVQDFIELRPALTYRDALAEMMSVDALLVLQASNCNAQIPAKIYEYLRAGKPILGLTDPAGDTAAILRGMGVTSLARLDSADDIAQALLNFMVSIKMGRLELPDSSAVKNASRRARSEAFVGLLNEVITPFNELQKRQVLSKAD